MQHFLFEYSAGGLIVRKTKILMVQVRNLEGHIVWTFPKGHIEKGETEEQTALREVYEETGWKCKILNFPISKKTATPNAGLSATTYWRITNPHCKSKTQKTEKIFESVCYKFKRNHHKISKKVLWFLMRPLSKTGKKDPHEILRVKWFSIREAERKTIYKSDKKLLKKLKLAFPALNIA